MTANKHGFEPKQEFAMGGISWTVIQTGKYWVKCIASDCIEKRAFDKGNENDFAASDICAYLNGEFLRRLIAAGAPEEMFEYFHIDLTAEDGLKNYGFDRVRIGLITCEEYRLLRGNIPTLSNRWWWTATADSPINPSVRGVSSDGVLSCYYAFTGSVGVRPVCVLKSEILKSYLFGGRDVKLKDTTNEAMMMGIKPCPFCGEKHTVNLSDCRECFPCEDEPYCDGCNWKKYLIVCNMNIGGCGAASGLYDTKEEAIEAWNRRCGN